MIEETLQGYMPSDWVITNVYRERQSLGSIPAVLWWVRAENEDEDYIKGFGNTIEDAIECMLKDLYDGFIQKNEWRHQREVISKITLTSLGLGSQNPKPRLTFRRPNAPTQTPTSTEG